MFVNKKMAVKCTQSISLDFLSSVGSEEVIISAASYNYNHHNLPFSYIMIIVVISDEDMLRFRSLDGR